MTPRRLALEVPLCLFVLAQPVMSSVDPGDSATGEVEKLPEGVSVQVEVVRSPETSGSGDTTSGQPDGTSVGTGVTYSYSPTCDSPGEINPGLAECNQAIDCGDEGVMMTVTQHTPGQADAFAGYTCAEPGEAGATPAAPTITPGMITRAFRRVPLPESTLTIQPPGGETLVNFDTLFSTQAEPFTHTLTMLGQTVELDITPTSFTWQHGDGTHQTTTTPGVPFHENLPQDTYISYQYDDADHTVHPAVDTTWTARFRINNGPWQPVDGTVTMTGDPTTLTILEASPRLAR